MNNYVVISMNTKPVFFHCHASAYAYADNLNESMKAVCKVLHGYPKPDSRLPIGPVNRWSTDYAWDALKTTYANQFIFHVI